MKMKRALGAISATALAALWSVPAAAAWTLNLREGVTELSREIYGLHMMILWICVVIAVAVFSVMIYSIATFRKSKGAVAADFDHNTKAEIIWTVIPVMILVTMAVAFGIFNVVASLLIGPRREGAVKSQTYESGMNPVGTARKRFNVRFYLIAMVFLVFDVETIFLYPWAVIVDELAWFGFIEMVVFLFILVVGYFYAWREGAFEWA
jgi:NADH-quinone oxidoreductase subunit A